MRLLAKCIKGNKKQRPEPLFFVGRPNGREPGTSDRDDDHGSGGCGHRGDDVRASDRGDGRRSCARYRDRPLRPVLA